eukprot:gb/GFBE01073406.1/.p1 GENE.gb/GFBE01073406.1/~~gb/GFBE01073406.1/.p1  ORF type:complete len:237 (+),score=28.77 gb/GFBE01073406.1/:1-711(+)
MLQPPHPAASQQPVPYGLPSSPTSQWPNPGSPPYVAAGQAPPHVASGYPSLGAFPAHAPAAFSASRGPVSYAAVQSAATVPAYGLASSSSSSSAGVLSSSSSGIRSHRVKTADYRQRMMVKVFLDNNGYMHVNEARHFWGRTAYPLHTAVRQNNPAVVQALLQMGANRGAKTTRGFTPEELARQKNKRRGSYEDVVKAFEEPHRPPAVTPSATASTVSSGYQGAVLGVRNRAVEQL